MKIIRYIKLEIKMGEEYHCSLEGTEKLIKFLDILIVNINHFVCDTLGFDGITFSQD